MRQRYEDSINNSLTKMFNTNRDYIDQEITRLSSVDQRSTEFRRNGTGDFGARQMSNYFGGTQGMVVGVSSSSTSVT